MVMVTLPSVSRKPSASGVPARRVARTCKKKVFLGHHYGEA
jgi:hypothetical protein